MKRTIALLLTITAAGSVMVAVFGAAPASAGSGVFSVTGCSSAGVRPDDPIVFPGRPGASHMHQFFGALNTSATSTYAQMIKSRSSCPLSADTAGYWAPALLDRSGRPVALKRATAYYRATTTARNLRAFPQDLRIIAGAPTVQTGSLMVGWSCDDSSAYGATIPDCTKQAGKYVKAHVIFPSCWDGKNLDSRDHRSHVVYPKGAGCPSSHPVRLPRLSVHFTWNVENGTGYSLASDRMMGTSNGRSLHADFWNTWNQRALEALVSACLVNGRECKDMTDANFASRTGRTISAPAGCTTCLTTTTTSSMTASMSTPVAATPTVSPTTTTATPTVAPAPTPSETSVPTTAGVP